MFESVRSVVESVSEFIPVCLFEVEFLCSVGNDNGGVRDVKNNGDVIRSNRWAGCNIVLKNVGCAVGEYYIWATLSSTRKKGGEVRPKI